MRIAVAASLPHKAGSAGTLIGRERMIKAFVPGARVRFHISGGARAWILKYLGESFYLIRTIPDRRELVAHEDDLVLEENHKEAKSG